MLIFTNNFIIPLPDRGGKDAKRIKEGERVIEDKMSYEGLFREIGKEIKEAKGE